MCLLLSLHGVQLTAPTLVPGRVLIYRPARRSVSRRFVMHYVLIGAEDFVFMPSDVCQELLCFWMPLVTATVRDAVSFVSPVARSLCPLLLCATQGARGGGGPKEKGGGGPKKASLTHSCDASAECACCLFGAELGPMAVTDVSLVRHLPAATMLPTQRLVSRRVCGITLSSVPTILC